MVRLGRVLWDAIDGLKTLLIALLIFALGLADYLDVVNVKPALDAALGEDRASKIMLFLPVVFGTLRFVTKDKVRWLRSQLGGDDQPDDGKNVDEGK